MKTNDKAKQKAAEWVNRHPSAVPKIVSVANDMMKEGNSLYRVCMALVGSRREFNGVDRFMFAEILRPYIEPIHFITERVVIYLTDEQKKMFAEMGTEPTEFVPQLVEWYRTAVYVNEKAKEINKENETCKSTT